MGEFQDYINIDSQLRLNLEDLPIKLLLKLLRTSSKEGLEGSMHPPSGVITLVVLPEQRSESYIYTNFAHELCHFFGKRLMRKNSGKEGDFYRSGIRTFKRLKRLNEGLTSLITKRFLDKFMKDHHFFVGPYSFETSIIRSLDEAIRRSESGDGVALFKAAYFSGRMLPMARVIDDIYKKYGGWKKFVELAENYEQASSKSKIEEGVKLANFVLTVLPKGERREEFARFELQLLENLELP